MMQSTPQISPRSRARITSAVYLLFFVTTIVGAIVTPSTAKDILAHEPLFRLGYALTLVSTACYVAMTALFYQLFKHVSRTPALAQYLLTPIEVVGILAEGVLMLWLLVMGVNSQRWNQMAAA